MRNPRQVSAQNVNSERRTHKKRAHPETPVTVHPSPIGTRVRFAFVAAVAFWIVLVSGQFSSIVAKYSPRGVIRAQSGFDAVCISTIQGEAMRSPVNCEQHKGTIKV
jgi:hypothetical protein